MVRNYIPKNIITINLDYHSDLETDYTWSEVLAGVPFQHLIEPKYEDIYTIIYTSGTSGATKGAVYTHQAISNYLGIFVEDFRRVTASKHLHILSYLPLAHVYERSAIQLGSVVFPSEVSFIESLETFAANMQFSNPTIFTGEPRIWSAFKNKIEHKISPHLLTWLLKLPGVSHYLKLRIKRQLGLDKTTKDRARNNFPFLVESVKSANQIN